jgi:CheY-like chemotaxis protein/HPt (histidine-containing phosphotransfer) domain-containing protein
VTGVEDGKTALNELKAASDSGDPYKLIILDRRMPEMDGFKVAQHIRQTRGDEPAVVMMLTSDDRLDDRSRIQDAGLSGYLVKPVGQSELLDAILDAIGNAAERIGNKGHADSSVTPEVLPPLNILLVEDNASNCRIIQFYLSAPRITLDIAENGKQAVSKYKTGEYDLILMDMQMPVLDGYSATKQIRDIERKQPLPYTPIIALTAHAFKEDRQKCLDSGCDDYLSKPVKKNRLIAAISEMIRRKESGEFEYPTKALEEPPEPLSEKIEDKSADNRVRIHLELKPLIPYFIDDCRKELIALRDAFTRSDFDIVSRLGHSIKGASRNYGFSVLGQIGLEIEMAGKDKNTDKIYKLILRFSDYLDHVQITYI